MSGLFKHLPLFGVVAVALAAIANNPHDPSSYGAAVTGILGALWQPKKQQQ